MTPRWLRGDVIAGIAVAAMIVPKDLGYAGIAGIPVENGLYAAAAAIIYGLFCMLDDATAADRSLDVLDHIVCDNRANAFAWRAYTGRAPGSADLPPYAAAARRQDPAELPRTWICVGDIEVFHAEVVTYAERLRASGVEVTLDIVPGAPHGFENWAADTPPAAALKARSRAWLVTTLRI